HFFRRLHGNDAEAIGSSVIFYKQKRFRINLAAFVIFFLCLENLTADVGQTLAAGFVVNLEVFEELGLDPNAPRIDTDQLRELAGQRVVLREESLLAATIPTEFARRIHRRLEPARPIEIFERKIIVVDDQLRLET